MLNNISEIEYINTLDRFLRDIPFKEVRPMASKFRSSIYQPFPSTHISLFLVFVSPQVLAPEYVCFYLTLDTYN